MTYDRRSVACCLRAERAAHASTVEPTPPTHEDAPVVLLRRRQSALATAMRSESMRVQLAARRRTLVTAGRLLAVVAVAAGLVTVVAGQASASTSQFKGVNWADKRDNFVNGVLYVSGLSSTDTYSSA